MKIDKIKLMGASALLASGLLANQAQAGMYSVWPTTMERQMAIDQACQEKANHQAYSTGTECPEIISDEESAINFKVGVAGGGILLVGAAIMRLRERQNKKKSENELDANNNGVKPRI